MGAGDVVKWSFSTLSRDVGFGVSFLSAQCMDECILLLSEKLRGSQACSRWLAVCVLLRSCGQRDVALCPRRARVAVQVEFAPGAGLGFGGASAKPDETVPAGGTAEAPAEAAATMVQSDAAAGAAAGAAQEDDDGDSNFRWLLPVVRHNAHEAAVEGELQTAEAGRLVLVWDNSFSYWNGKNVTMSLEYVQARSQAS